MGVVPHNAPEQQREVLVSVLVWGKQHNTGQVPPASSALTLHGARDLQQLKGITEKLGSHHTASSVISIWWEFLHFDVFHPRSRVESQDMLGWWHKKFRIMYAIGKSPCFLNKIF